MSHKKLVIAIVGPTASGKSELAVKVAKMIDGEIISADSRQIYTGLNIGSGKVAGRWEKLNGRNVYVYKKVPHHLIDEANPKRQYSVAQFQRKAQKIMADMFRRGKTPIICGGTAHWIDALIFNQALPAVKPNAQLRAQLGKLSVEQMFAKLRILDPERAAEIDSKNPRRLLRSLEIVMATGKPVPRPKSNSVYNVLWLGIKPDQEVLNQKIAKRFQQWMKAGLLKEVAQLKQGGLSWARVEGFGLEYKFIAQYLQNKINLKQAEGLSTTSIRQYAKRQMTWWKRNPNIHWSSEPTKLLALAKKLKK